MLQEADLYFKNHIEADTWKKITNEEDREIVLEKAETMINNSIDLRTGTKDLPIYQYAIFEQAIFLLTFDKERSRLQREGVTIYKVDDITIHQNQSIISPVTIEFLKKYTYKKLGEIT